MMFAFPVRGEGRIVYGKDFAFSVVPPKGWVLDIRSGAQAGLNMVLYPQGETWSDAPAILYGRVLRKGKKGLSEIIGEDESDFMKRCPQGSIQAASAQMRLFTCPGEAYEAVSFIDTGPMAVLLVLSSRTQKAFNANRKNFEAFTGSFNWIASKTATH